jgi:hypothetical protein
MLVNLLLLYLNCFGYKIRSASLDCSEIKMFVLILKGFYNICINLFHSLRQENEGCSSLR